MICMFFNVKPQPSLLHSPTSFLAHFCKVASHPPTSASVYSSSSHLCSWLISTLTSSFNLNASSRQSSHSLWCPGLVLSLSPDMLPQQPLFSPWHFITQYFIAWIFACVWPPPDIKKVIIRTITLLALIPAGFLNSCHMIFRCSANTCWMDSALSSSYKCLSLSLQWR